MKRKVILYVVVYEVFNSVSKTNCSLLTFSKSFYNLINFTFLFLFRFLQNFFLLHLKRLFFSKSFFLSNFEMNLTEKSSLQRSKDTSSDKDSGIYEVTSNLSVASSLSSTSSRANRFRSNQASIATKEADDVTPQLVSKSSRQYRDDSRYLYDVTNDVSYEKQRLIGEVSCFE